MEKSAVLDTPSIGQNLERAGERSQGLNPPHQGPVLSKGVINQLPGAENIEDEDYTARENTEAIQKDSGKLISRLIGKFSPGHTEKREGPEGNLWRRFTRSRVRKNTQALNKPITREEPE